MFGPPDKIVEVSYTHKCLDCGYEHEISHVFQPGEFSISFPIPRRCENCQKDYLDKYPPIGYLYYTSINGMKILSNEYLVNPKLRNELLKEQPEIENINNDIEAFEKRKNANSLTKEEGGFLRHFLNSKD
jgi:hypothetical protein